LHEIALCGKELNSRLLLDFRDDGYAVDSFGASQISNKPQSNFTKAVLRVVLYKTCCTVHYRRVWGTLSGCAVELFVTVAPEGRCCRWNNGWMRGFFEFSFE
jgi:hypothetical protein